MRAKKRAALPDVLDRAELSQLLDVPGREGVWERVHAGQVERDRLLLALFSYSGLRRSELLGLDLDDVDLDRCVFRVRNAKGEHERVVPVYPGLVPLVIAYVGVRPQSSDPALFLGVHGRRLTGRHPGDHVPPLCRRGRRDQAQAHHAAHAAPSLRDRAAQCGREPTPDPARPRQSVQGRQR
jgi:integrase